MSEWNEFRIGDLLKLEYGKSLTDYRTDEGKFEVFGTNGKIGTTNVFLFDERSLVIGRKGAYREVHLADKPFFVIDTAFYTKQLNELSDTLFMYYWFKNIDINSMDSGSAIPSTSRDEVYDLEIFLPPLPEQKAIAEVLSSLDDKIELLHRQNQTLEQMAETLFRQWFVEEADEGWEWRQLDEFVEVQRGLSYKGAGLTDVNGGIPMHNLNSVYEGGGYKESGIKYYSGEYKDRHKVFSGDVIITNTEQGHEHLLIGYPAIVPSNFGEFGIFSHHIFRLEIKSKLSNFYLLHLLKSTDVHDQIAGATNGSTVNMLPKDGVEWVKFKLPPQEMIDNFTQIVQGYNKKQDLNTKQIRTLTALRDNLLPKLMSGEAKACI